MAARPSCLLLASACLWLGLPFTGRALAAEVKVKSAPARISVSISALGLIGTTLVGGPALSNTAPLTPPSLSVKDASLPLLPPSGVALVNAPAAPAVSVSAPAPQTPAAPAPAKAPGFFQRIGAALRGKPQTAAGQPSGPQAMDSLRRAADGLAPGAASQPSAVLASSFDGAQASADDASLAPVRPSRSGFTPHERMPAAFLPNGAALPPPSMTGGFHGATISPETVIEQGGFAPRGPVEDWRLREHSEEKSAPVSAFRGSTAFVASAEGDAGAAYWAGEGSWVYDVRGVPTWDLEAALAGRVQRADGTFRGSLMHEAEAAIPAQTPLECIERWGQVQESSTGKLYVRPNTWVANPRYDPELCRKFWGAGR